MPSAPSAGSKAMPCAVLGSDSQASTIVVTSHRSHLPSDCAACLASRGRLVREGP